MNKISKELHKLAMEIYQIYQFGLDSNGLIIPYENMSSFNRERYDRCLNIAILMNKKIAEAIETEYSQETIPLFDSLFTDAEYRKSFYNAIEERIKEIKNESN